MKNLLILILITFAINAHAGFAAGFLMGSAAGSDTNVGTAGMVKFIKVYDNCEKGKPTGKFSYRNIGYIAGVFEWNDCAMAWFSTGRRVYIDNWNNFVTLMESKKK